MLPTLAIALLLALAQDGPVPPQRVDPQSLPTPTAADPVLPRESEQTESQDTPKKGVAPWRTLDAPPAAPARSPTQRRYEAASIFTDEGYRHARVRWLLERALEGFE